MIITISILRLFLILFLLGLANSAFAILSLNVGEEEIALYDKSYALVIGVSDYEHWPDLPGVEADVQQVSEELKKQGFVVQKILDPSRKKLDQALRQFMADYGQQANSRMLFYYAGHGYTLTTSRKRRLGYIVPADAPLPENNVGGFKKYAVSMREIENYATELEAKHALFLFDSCFSGTIFDLGATRAVPATISEKTARPVRQFITAGAADQEVPDQSIFQAQFLSGLKGEADLNEDNYITGTELAQFLQDSVTNYSYRSQTPQYGKIRDPYLDKGDFVFILPKKIEVKVQVKQDADDEAVELTYWESIKGSRKPELYQTYLEQYPEGKFAKLAKVFIDSMPEITRQEQAALAAKTRLFDNKSIVLVPRGEVNPAWGSINETQYTSQVAKIIQQAISPYLSGSATVETVISKHNNRKVNKRKLCTATKADIIISATVRTDVSSDNESQLLMSHYSCKTKDTQTEKYNLTNEVNDAYKYQHAMVQSVAQLVTTLMRGQSETPVLSGPEPKKNRRNIHVW